MVVVAELRCSCYRRGLTVVVVIAVCASAWWSGGCRGRDGSPGSDAEADDASPETPLAVAGHLRDWHRERRYRLLEPYVEPEQRVLLVDTLMAFNRFLEANERSQRRLWAMHGERVGVEFDLSHLADAMGLFSPDVEFRSERIDGNQAVLSVQVAGRVPLEEHQFVRRDRRWVYAPESPIPSLPELIHELAAGMEEFTRQLEKGDLSVARVRSEFRHRVYRRIRKIRSALPGPQPSTTSRSASQPR